MAFTGITEFPHYAWPRALRVLPSASEMAELDRRAISGGVPSLELMERAAEQLAEVISERLLNIPHRQSKGQAVIILCGCGNNGGDGLAAARILRARLPAAKKVSISCVLVSAERYSADCRAQVEKLVSARGALFLCGAQVSGLDTFFKLPKIEMAHLNELLRTSQIVVDALLGTGQQSAPHGVIADIIKEVELLRSADVRRAEEKRPEFFLISADIPSGVCASSGRGYEPRINADLTVTFEYPKRGMLQFPARSACGNIAVRPIGIESRLGQQEVSDYVLTSLFDADFLPSDYADLLRSPDCHKGLAGTVLVIGGSNSMPGAPLLSAYAALRSGAGLVKYTLWPAVPAAVNYPELIGVPCRHTLSEGIDDAILDQAHLADCVIIGPGLGAEQSCLESFEVLLGELARQNKPLVLDADGLNLLAKLETAKSKELLTNAILTPHPGEMARLLGCDTAAVQADRYQAAGKLCDKFGCVILLKGAGTITAHGSRAVVNPNGNPFMATAGSGDVLSGMIAALIAQRMRVFDAGKLAAFLHGAAGDFAHAKHAGPITATDIVACIPNIMGRHIFGAYNSDESSR